MNGYGAGPSDPNRRAPSLVSVRPVPAPSYVPTEHLANQADKWVPGSASSPVPYGSPAIHDSFQPMPQMPMPTARAPSWDASAAAAMQQQQNANAFGAYQPPPHAMRHSFNGAIPVPSNQAPPQHVQANLSPYPPQHYQQPQPQSYQIPPQASQSAFLTPVTQPLQQQQQQQHNRPPRVASMNDLAPAFEKFSIASQSTAPVQAPVGTRKGRSYYSNPQDGPPFKLAVSFPDQNMLASMRETALANGGDMQRKIAWSKQVLKFIERHQAAAGETSRINDPVLVKWTDEALNHILSSASSPNPVPLALYLRGDLSSTGSFPSYRSKDLKLAFRDFEAAANAGYEKAWFRIGRAYEDFGDIRRAVGAYEIGVSKGDCGSTYRMAMAYLLGQISVTPDYRKAIQLLYRAADTADLDTSQPPYILGMLLSGDFESPSVQIPTGLVPVDIEEARCRIERSAYLSFGPAQYKMGYAYEYAKLGCLHDPLLSVQYYALASQNGEVEADMALSKWYLCGSEGHFDKNERLAYTFAEKAASRNLASAEFALGYYLEVGIHVTIDVEQAKRWYSRAASHGNSEARERIQALSQSDSNVLSRTDHEAQIDQRLVRKRTQAMNLSNQRREQMESNRLAASIAGSGPVQLPPPRASSSTVPAANERYGATPSAAYPQDQATGTTGRRRRDTLRQVEAAANMQYQRPQPVPSGQNSLANSTASMANGGGSRRPSGNLQPMMPNSNSGLSSSQSSSRLTPYQLVDLPSASAMNNKVQRPPPQQQSQQQYARPPQQQQGGPARRPSNQSIRQQDIPVRKKPETFSEMGIVTVSPLSYSLPLNVLCAYHATKQTKAKKDDCVIM